MPTTCARGSRTCNALQRLALGAIAAFFATGIVAAVGCGKPQAAPVTAHPRNASGQATPEETWDAIFQDDIKIGYSHTQIEHVKGGAGNHVKIVRQQHLKLQRFGQSLEVTVQLESVETSDGKVISFLMRTEAGPSPIVVEGRVVDHQLRIVTTSKGKQSTRAMAWPKETGGFFADELSLRRAPMKPGEQRTLKMLWPGLTSVQIVTTDLEALQHEDASLMEGHQQLLKIKANIQIGDQSIEGYYWTTGSGKLQKTLLAGMNQVSYRTTEAVAMAASAGGEFDLGRSSVVHVTTPLPSPYQTQRVVYEARLPDSDPVKVFVTETGQAVEAIDAHTARITVTSVRPNRPEKVAPGAASQPADVQPNNMIQSDDPKIIKLAHQIAPQETDPWQVAIALERWVRNAIRNKNFSQGFATAADVAQTLEGDCTEHAVLLAALCRTRKIPTRVAVGLVYSAADQGFAFHMWNQVWIRDCWIPLDGTLGLGGTGAAHITLDTSNLSTSEAETMILRVVKVLGQLQLRILEYAPHS